MRVLTGRSMLMTKSTCSLSIPRAVTSVLISTLNLKHVFVIYTTCSNVSAYQYSKPETRVRYLYHVQ